VNDISALRMDEQMMRVLRDTGVPAVLMHMLGTPKTMQTHPSYDNLLEDIRIFLEIAINRAVSQGIDRNRIIIDPGIGFGKTFEHNLTLIRHLKHFEHLGCPILLGPSRKAFIRHLLARPPEKDLPPDSPVVETGTQAVVAVAAMKGVDILRVHRVAETKATLTLIEAIKNAGGGQGAVDQRPETKGDWISSP
jgi:dihydropteroate synthase